MKRKYKHAYLLDDLTLVSESFQYNGTPFIKKPRFLDFNIFDRIWGAWGVLIGRFYPIYFADDFLKDSSKEIEI